MGNHLVTGVYSVRQQQIRTCALDDERRVAGETQTSTEGDGRATDPGKQGTSNQLSAHVLIRFFFPVLSVLSSFVLLQY